MKLIHFNDYGFSKELLVPRVQGRNEHNHAYTIGKPSGLWVSDEDEFGWSQWCEGESFGRGKVAHAVELAKDHNVLILSTPEAVRAFGAKYDGGELYPGQRSHWTDVGADIQLLIAWEKVAEDYDGVIITPYQWSNRFDLHWYYTWDCASGCIWEPRAIESITALDGEWVIPHPDEDEPQKLIASA